MAVVNGEPIPAPIRSVFTAANGANVPLQPKQFREVVSVQTNARLLFLRRPFYVGGGIPTPARTVFLRWKRWHEFAIAFDAALTHCRKLGFRGCHAFCYMIRALLSAPVRGRSGSVCAGVIRIVCITSTPPAAVAAKPSIRALRLEFLPARRTPDFVKFAQLAEC